MNDFIKSIFGKSNATVIAVFKDGTTAEYSAYMLKMLLSDSGIECVFDSATGEVLEG